MATNQRAKKKDLQQVAVDYNASSQKSSKEVDSMISDTSNVNLSTLQYPTGFGAINWFLTIVLGVKLGNDLILNEFGQNVIIKTIANVPGNRITVDVNIWFAGDKEQQGQIMEMY